MSQNADSGSNDRDKALDRLVRASGQLEGASFTRPSDEVIQAYLEGTANKSAKKQMHEALRASAEFRQEILEMATDLEELVDPALAESMKKVQVGEVPDFSTHTRKPTIEGPEEYAAKARKGFISTQVVPAFAAAARVLTPKFAVPAVALTAAIIALMLSTQSGREQPGWMLVDADVDPNLLVMNQTRGSAAQAGSESYPTAISAAYGAFRFALDLDDDGNFVPWSGLRDVRPVSLGRTLILRIAAGQDQIISEISVSVPIADTKPRGPVQAWLYTLRSRKMYRYELNRDISLVNWKDLPIEPSAVAFTYPDDERYRFAVTFDFPFFDGD